MWTLSIIRRPYDRADGKDFDDSDAFALDDDDVAHRIDNLAMEDPLDEKLGLRRPLSRQSLWAKLAEGWRERPKMLSPSWRRPSFDRLTIDKSTMKAWLIFPLPSWSHAYFGFPIPDGPHRPTDYLDGLRGVASLFVLLNHYLMGGFDEIASFGFGEGNHWNLIQLPFIRTTYSGAAMVSIFFVISGYVLSIRALAAVRAGKQEKVYSVLTSMTFRRALRLFLPSLASSLVMLMAVLLGIERTEFPRNWTLSKEIWHYRLFLRDYLFRLWTWEDPLRLFGGPDWHGWYGGQLWTIPLEFLCSMIVFLLLIATARCTVRIRLFTVATSTVYLFYVGRWDLGSFFAGTAIAELNLIAEGRPKPPHVHVALWVILIGGWYLVGMARNDQGHTPGYEFLSGTWAIDELSNWRFWLAIASIMVVGSLSFLPVAQHAFTTPIARYLGKISYALYLVHPLPISVLRPIFWSAFGVLKHPGHHDNPITWNWVFATLLFLPCVLWIADIFWRAIDEPAVKFAKWVEKICFLPQLES